MAASGSKAVIFTALADSSLIRREYLDIRRIFAEAQSAQGFRCEKRTRRREERAEDRRG